MGSACLGSLWDGAGGEVRKLVLGVPRSDSGRRYLMALVAYIDDSYDRSGTFVLGGHVASAESWAQLSEEWQELLPFATLNKHGRREFKMYEMMKNPERIERIQPFYRLIEKYIPHSISVSFNFKALARARARLLIPGMNIDWSDFGNRYFFAYRGLMDIFHSERHQMPGFPADAVIDFVFDKQTEARMVQSGWDHYVSERNDRVRDLYGEMPLFRDSEKFMPLQAADLWAGFVRRCESEGNRAALGLRDFGSWKAVSKTPVATHVSWDDEGLVRTMKSLLRQHTGLPIYDIRFPV